LQTNYGYVHPAVAYLPLRHLDCTSPSAAPGYTETTVLKCVVLAQSKGWLSMQDTPNTYFLQFDRVKTAGYWWQWANRNSLYWFTLSSRVNLLLSFFFSSPIWAVADWMSTILPHMVRP